MASSQPSTRPVTGPGQTPELTLGSPCSHSALRPTHLGSGRAQPARTSWPDPGGDHAASSSGRCGPGRPSGRLRRGRERDARASGSPRRRRANPCPLLPAARPGTGEMCTFRGPSRRGGSGGPRGRVHRNRPGGAGSPAAPGLPGHVACSAPASRSRDSRAPLPWQRLRRPAGVGQPVEAGLRRGPRGTSGRREGAALGARAGP